MTPSVRRPLSRTVAVLAALVLAASMLATTAPADAATTWAPADTATIHPGVQTYTDGGQCTANFVFEGNGTLYLGQSAHCAGTGAATDTDGCDAGSLAIGTEVRIAGASYPGTLAYSSWLAMQEHGADANACRYNDFALIEIDARDHDKVNPSVPFWGGPVALGDATSFGETVHSYGNSSLRLGLTALSPKQGMSLGATAGGWNHPVYTVSPGVPGDSGSAFLDADGNAVGTLSTLAIAPLAGSNGVTDLGLALAYANDSGEIGTVRLVEGTEVFRPIL